MDFVHPAVLLLLWLLPPWAALAVWARRRRRARLSRLGPAAVRAAGAGGVFAAQLALCAAGLALCIVALARPQWGEREEPAVSAARNVLILLDVSRSMLAQDVHPNRLDRAKADLADLVADLRGDRAGLVAFRNGARMVCPFTTDAGFLRSALDAAGPDSAPRGETDIGAALALALEKFAPLEGDNNAVVLVSDGEDLSGEALELARRCGEARIPVFCLGVGGSRGAEIPVGDRGGEAMEYRGEKVLTRLDNRALAAVASASGGVYLPLASVSVGSATLGSIYQDHVRALVRQEAGESARRARVERYGWFLAPGLLLLLVAAALSRGRPGVRPRRRAAAPAVAVLLVLLAMPAAAGTDPAAVVGTDPKAVGTDPATVASTTATGTDPTAVGTDPEATATGSVPAPADRRDLAREAQRARRAGDSAEALRLYREALDAPAPADPALERDIRYNAALAALDAGEDEAAAELFRSVDGPDAATGLGLALFRRASAPPEAPATNLAARAAEAKRAAETMADAAAAFRDALRARPRDPAATTNLATALARIPVLRDEAREAALAARFDGKEAPALLEECLREARAAYAAAAPAFTNPAPARIAALEDAALRQRAAADVWGPLSRRLLAEAKQAITNADDYAAFEHTLAEAADRAEGAVGALEKLDPAALDAMRRAEGAAFGLAAMSADPPAQLAIALDCQSNALSRVADVARMRTPVAEQAAAIGLFRTFADRLQPWLDALAAASSNAPAAGPAPVPQGPPPEAREEIQRLCDETLGIHALLGMGGISPADAVLPDDQLPNARQSAANIARLLELLRPPQQQQQQQQNQDQQQDQQDQQNQDQQQQDQQQQQQQNQDQQQQDQDDRNDQDQQDQQDQQDSSEPQDAEKKEAEAREAEEDPDRKAAEEIMAKVLELEKRRAEERRARQGTLPPRVGERDW